MSLDVVASKQFANADIVYGIRKLPDNLCEAVIVVYRPGTLAEMSNGHIIGPDAKVSETVVAVGPEVCFDYKETGVFSKWPKPITIKVEEKNKVREKNLVERIRSWFGGPVG